MDLSKTDIETWLNQLEISKEEFYNQLLRQDLTQLLTEIIVPLTIGIIFFIIFCRILSKCNHDIFYGDDDAIVILLLCFGITAIVLCGTAILMIFLNMSDIITNLMSPAQRLIQILSAQ